MKNAVAYVRVSTDNQAREDKFGIEAQKEMINEYCEKNDIEITKWYIESVSGVKEEREEFYKILCEENNPPTDCVVIAKSDRLARDINVYFYYKMMLKKKDIELVSVQEDFGQFGVFAPMLESFVICVADMERRNITTRTSAGRKVKASKGGYSGGKAPYGYMISNGRLVVVEKNAECVRMIFELKDKGYTLQAIANEVNRMGYLNNSGKQFQTSSIQTILANRKTYQGYYKYGKNGEWVEGEHEALIEE